MDEHVDGAIPGLHELKGASGDVGLGGRDLVHEAGLDLLDGDGLVELELHAGGPSALDDGDVEELHEREADVPELALDGGEGGPVAGVLRPALLGEGGQRGEGA